LLKVEVEFKECEKEVEEPDISVLLEMGPPLQLGEASHITSS
jgi:hypothetical protein